MNETPDTAQRTAQPVVATGPLLGVWISASEQLPKTGRQVKTATTTGAPSDSDLFAEAQKRRKAIISKTKTLIEVMAPGFTSSSRAEEVIATLWTIAAILAQGLDIPFWIVVCLYFKAATDHLCAIQCSFREYREARILAEKSVASEEEGRAK